MLKQMQRRWAPVLFVSIAVIVFNTNAAEAKRVALLILSLIHI